MPDADPVLRFGPFELDRNRFELRRQGDPVRLEPKVLELLVYLAERPDRLVTRDELVQEVWKGTFVGDAALARAVHEARKALGETATAPRYLRTVHGRGYRFVAGDATAGDRGRAGPAPPPPDQPARRRRSWGVAVGLAVAAAAIAVLALSTFRRETGAGPAPSTGPARLAILPFSISDPDPESQLVGLSLTDLLYARLQRVEGLIVRPPDPPGGLEVKVASIAEYAESVGANLLLTGSLRPESGSEQLDLTLEIVSFERPAGVRQIPLGRYSLPRLEAGVDMGNFLTVRDAVVDRVLELMGPAVASSARGGHEPHDPEAYRLYLLAYRKLLENFCAGDAAEELVLRSLEIDPDFALAWDVLATAYYNRVWACGEEASLYDKAIEASDRALALDPDLPQSRFRKISLLIETGDVESAYAMILERLAERPDSPMALNAQSYALRVAGFLDASRQALDRLLEVDPLVFDTGALGGSPNTLLYQGEIDRFLRQLPAAEMPYIRYYRGYAKLLQGDREAARAELEPAFRMGPGEVFGRLSAALLAIAEDDRQAARRIVESLAAQRERLGGADGEITYKEAQLLARAGAEDAAIGRLETAVRQGFFCSLCLSTDPSLESLRGHPRWAAVLEAATRRHRSFGERFGLSPEA